MFTFFLVPLDIAASMVLVWYLVAWQALIGASFFLLVVAYGSYAAHKAGKVRHQSAAVTDKRLEIMKEIVTGIRVVKMYAWEGNFTGLVAQIRRLVLIYWCLSNHLGHTSAKSRLSSLSEKSTWLIRVYLTTGRFS